MYFKIIHFNNSSMMLYAMNKLTLLLTVIIVQQVFIFESVYAQ